MFGAFRGTLAEASAYGNAGNSELVSVLAIGAMPSSPWDAAAAYAMRAATSLADDPALPLQTLELTGLKAPRREDRWNMEERNILLYDGMATFMVVSDDTVQIECEVTMYQKKFLGHGRSLLPGRADPGHSGLLALRRAQPHHAEIPAP